MIMNFAIDFDSRTVESKSDKEQELLDYVESNGLGMAVAIVSSADDLVLQFSLEELQGVIDNLASESDSPTVHFDNEEDAAEQCWEELNDRVNTFPKYTKALGKKLIKKASKPDPVDNSKPDKLVESKPTKIKVKANELIGMDFSNTGKQPREGTACRIITDFIEENLGEGSFQDIVEDFVNNYVPKNPDKKVDEALGKVYVREAFVNGFIEEAL